MCIFSGAVSFALSLSHACILCFPPAHLCDYRDNNRDQNYPFFSSGAKDASPYDVLVICLYVYNINAPVYMYIYIYICIYMYICIYAHFRVARCYLIK